MDHRETHLQIFFSLTYLPISLCLHFRRSLSIVLEEKIGGWRKSSGQAEIEISVQFFSHVCLAGNLG